MSVLYTTRQTTLHESRTLTATALRELYQYVADLDLLICGPQYRFFYGMDGQPDTPVTLEIALPVQGLIPTALLPFFKQIAPFNCLSARYEGSWDRLSDGYADMMRYIFDNDLKMNGMYVESLLHIDFSAPACQLTEIQVGLCPSSCSPKAMRSRHRVAIC
jgi:hypothetical protein